MTSRSDSSSPDGQILEITPLDTSLGPVKELPPSELLEQHPARRLPSIPPGPTRNTAQLRQAAPAKPAVAKPAAKPASQPKAAPAKPSAKPDSQPVLEELDIDDADLDFLEGESRVISSESIGLHDPEPVTSVAKAPEASPAPKAPPPKTLAASTAMSAPASSTAFPLRGPFNPLLGKPERIRDPALLAFLSDRIKEGFIQAHPLVIGSRAEQVFGQSLQKIYEGYLLTRIPDYSLRVDLQRLHLLYLNTTITYQTTSMAAVVAAKRLEDGTYEMAEAVLFHSSVLFS